MNTRQWTRSKELKTMPFLYQLPVVCRFAEPLSPLSLDAAVVPPSSMFRAVCCSNSWRVRFSVSQSSKLLQIIRVFCGVFELPLLY